MTGLAIGPNPEGGLDVTGLAIGPNPEGGLDVTWLAIGPNPERPAASVGATLMPFAIGLQNRQSQCIPAYHNDKYNVVAVVVVVMFYQFKITHTFA